MLRILFLLTTCFFFTVSFLFAQSTLIDSIQDLPDTAQIAAYETLVQKYLRNDLEKTLELAEKGIELAQKKGNKKALALFLLNRGNVYVYKGKFNKALTFLKQSMAVSKEIDDSMGIANAYTNIGVIYKRQGKYDLCVEVYLKALKIYESKNKKVYIARMLNNLGSAHISLSNRAKALEYFQKGLKLGRSPSIPFVTSSLLNNIGYIYLFNKQYAKAIKVLRESLTLSKKDKNYPRIINTLDNIANIYQKQNKLDSALFYHQKAEQAHKKYRYSAGLVSRYLSMARTYNLLHQTTLANQYYQKALQITLQNKETSLLIEIYQEFHKYQASQQKYRQAYDYLLKFNVLKDSLLSLEKNKQVEELKAQYELDKKQKQVALLAKENEIKTLEARQQKSAKQVLFLVVAILSTLFILFINRYRLKRKSNQLLEQKNLTIAQALEEKEMLLKEVHHRVKNNLQIISSLLNLQGEFNQQQDPKSLLKQSQHKIQTMAIIHEKLYQSDSLASIGLKSYLESLIQHFKNGYDLANQNISFETQIDEITLKMDHLVPCGLIINELVTNSLKYAFPHQTSGQINIKASQKGETCVLTIEDNGIGLPAGFTLDNLNSLGLRLVQGLTHQLKGALEILKSEGAGFKITFSI